MEYAVTRALPAGDISALCYAGRPDRRSAAFFIGPERSG
jgi:hypothetical protein